MTIREVGRSGERKNPRMRRKKRKKTRAGRVDAGLKQDLGAKLGANDLGINGNDVEVSATSTLCLRRCRCHARTLALIGLAPRRVTSGPIITVPSRGYRFWKHIYRGIFVKIFQRRTQKTRISVSHTIETKPLFTLEKLWNLFTN